MSSTGVEPISLALNLFHRLGIGSSSWNLLHRRGIWFVVVGSSSSSNLLCPLNLLGWIFTAVGVSLTVVGLDWPQIPLIAVEPVSSSSKPSGRGPTHIASVEVSPPADGL